MMINVPITTDSDGVYADLSRVGLGHVKVVPKPNFRHTERPHVEGWDGHVDMTFLKKPAMMDYDVNLIVVSGKYAGYTKRLGFGDVAIISTNDFSQFFFVVTRLDNGGYGTEEIDIKTIHRLKDILIYQDKGIY